MADTTRYVRRGGYGEVSGSAIRRRIVGLTGGAIGLALIGCTALPTAASAAGASAAAVAAAAGPNLRTDSCTPAWRIAHTPAPNGKGGVLFSTSAASATDAWAVGYVETDNGFRTLIERWDGASWSLVPGQNPGPADDTLADVSVRTPNDVWAVGSATAHGMPAQALTEHWDGTVWSTVAAQKSESDRRLLAIAVAEHGTAWAVGLDGSGEGSIPLVLRWNGAKWSAQRLPHIPGGALHAVAVAGSNDVWAVGTITRSGSPRSLALHWNGSRWSVVPTPDPADGASLSGITMLSPKDGWAVGHAGPEADSSTLAMHWNGQAWTEVPTPSVGASGDARFAQVAGSSPLDIWAVGGFLDVRTGRRLNLIEHWDGTRWTFVHSLGPQANRNYLADVTWVPGYGVWAAGYSATDHAPRPLVERMCPATLGGTGLQPATVRSVLGETLTWRVEDGQTHGLADVSGLALFDSGSLAPGAAFTYAFPAAGTFAVMDPTTGQRSTVSVSLRKHPLVLHPGTWRFTWGIGRAPRGMRYVVQIHRPTSQSFEPWITGTYPSDDFTPGGVGIWVFRAALQDVSSGVISGWSPNKRLIVP